jgi:ATP-dependent helicase HrpB
MTTTARPSPAGAMRAAAAWSTPRAVLLLPLLCRPRAPPVRLCEPALPIAPLLPSIVSALKASPNLVLQAPPGAGKTTTVPLALLEDGTYRSILVLEPRRIAARSAASRMASLLGEELGGTVGYRVRLEGASGPRTRVLVVTEGILVRRLQADPALRGVDVVIFDEFHERSVNADVCLALCVRAQARARERGAPGPKLLVMSATLGDTAALQRLLGGCGAVTSEGRCFPVTLRRVPGSVPLAMAANGRPSDIGRTVAAAVATALAEAAGDVLAFLPGEGEIRATASALDELLPAAARSGLIIAPLFGAQVEDNAKGGEGGGRKPGSPG